MLILLCPNHASGREGSELELERFDLAVKGGWFHAEQTGGGALIAPGASERLCDERDLELPDGRIKIHAALLVKIKRARVALRLNFQGAGDAFDHFGL